MISDGWHAGLEIEEFGFEPRAGLFENWFKLTKGLK